MNARPGIARRDAQVDARERPVAVRSFRALLEECGGGADAGLDPDDASPVGAALRIGKQSIGFDRSCGNRAMCRQRVEAEARGAGGAQGEPADPDLFGSRRTERRQQEADSE